MSKKPTLRQQLEDALAENARLKDDLAAFRGCKAPEGAAVWAVEICRSCETGDKVDVVDMVVNHHWADEKPQPTYNYFFSEEAAQAAADLVEDILKNAPKR